MGIAMCHLIMGLEEKGMHAGFFLDAQEIATPENTVYTATLILPE